MRKTVEAGIKAVEALLPVANEARRTRQPVSELVLATNCGGSDGNSGITANPALGYASDMVVRCGGTTILGETTEIYGAEQLLTRRARTPANGGPSGRSATQVSRSRFHSDGAASARSPGRTAAASACICSSSLALSAWFSWTSARLAARGRPA